MADNITISKTYLEILLRRAELQHAGESVTISATHYNSLLQDATQLRSLKAALIDGGASEDTLEVLVNSRNASTLLPTYRDDTCAQLQKHTSQSVSTAFGSRLQECGSHSACHHEKGLTAGHGEKSLLPPTPTSLTHDDKTQQAGRHKEHPLYAVANADRSLVFSGMPSSSSLSDVTKAIRGGSVSNVFLRHRERLAHISFVHPESALEFYEHSRKNKIYVKGKSVKVFWDAQQAYLSGRVISRIIQKGATRNLVIRFVTPEITADTIRADLDHIFRLQILDINFEGGHAWVQTNSIAVAITAQECLSSQKRYRALRIEFFPDECNAPLPSTTNPGKARLARPTGLKPAAFQSQNSFQALSNSSSSCEVSDDGSGNESFSDA